MSFNQKLRRLSEAIVEVRAELKIELEFNSWLESSADSSVWM